MSRTMHVELLLERRILDRTGAKMVGHVHDLQAEGDEVTFVLTGERGLLERLWGLHRLRSRRRGYRIRWDQIEWNESGPLRLRCDVSELDRM